MTIPILFQGLTRSPRTASSGSSQQHSQAVTGNISAVSSPVDDDNDAPPEFPRLVPTGTSLLRRPENPTLMSHAQRLPSMFAVSKSGSDSGAEREALESEPKVDTVKLPVAQRKLRYRESSRRLLQEVIPQYEHFTPDSEAAMTALAKRSQLALNNEKKDQLPQPLKELMAVEWHRIKHKEQREEINKLVKFALDNFSDSMSEETKAKFAPLIPEDKPGTYTTRPVTLAKYLLNQLSHCSGSVQQPKSIHVHMEENVKYLVLLSLLDVNDKSSGQQNKASQKNALQVYPPQADADYACSEGNEVRLQEGIAKIASSTNSLSGKVASVYADAAAVGLDELTLDHVSRTRYGSYEIHIRPSLGLLLGLPTNDGNAHGMHRFIKKNIRDVWQIDAKFKQSMTSYIKRDGIQSQTAQQLRELIVKIQQAVKEANGDNEKLIAALQMLDCSDRMAALLTSDPAFDHSLANFIELDESYAVTGSGLFDMERFEEKIKQVFSKAMSIDASANDVTIQSADLFSDETASNIVDALSTAMVSDNQQQTHRQKS